MTQQSRFAPEIENNPEWSSAVHRANAWVHEALGRWAGGKVFEWAVRTGPRGEPLFDLCISAEGGAAADRFDRFEIANESIIRNRVGKLWGDLLNQVTHTQVEDLKRMRDEWKKEAAVGTQD